MMNALEKSDIRVIVVRHEQGAAFMADEGVCFSTLGPGATNLITGTADANSEPLIAITGQVDAFDFSSVSGSGRAVCTNHQAENSVNEIVRIAFKYAESEKPGACHVDLPTNVNRGQLRYCRTAFEKAYEYASFSSIDQAAMRQSTR